MGKLTALAVKSAKPGRHGDGSGLYLFVKPSGAKSWLLRVQRDGRRRDIGLGSIAALNLAEAREKAALLRKHALNGRDPIAERDRDRRTSPTFREAAKLAHADLGAGWAPKTAAGFLSSLEEHAFPVLGSKRVDEIEAADVQAALRPIWLTIPVMARKVRQRIGIVLNYSHGRRWRESEAPGRGVTVGLPKQPAQGNFDAMAYSDVPGFVAKLRSEFQTAGRRALLFLVLTGARSGEVRGARWGQIDWQRQEWNRPTDIMKNRQPHTVTLSSQAMALLEEMRGAAEPKADALIFPGARKAKLSDMTLTAVLRRMKLTVDTHGFRSSFRDWAAEQMPHIPDPVAEAALAHVVPDKVVRAYKRTKFMEMRRELLEGWGAFCASGVGE
jgi:integrase